MDSIQVAIRVRPLNEAEVGNSAAIPWNINGSTLIPLIDGRQLASGAFTFDAVFGPDCSETQKIFEKIAQPVVASTLNGVNGTIFAYGQTSAGKTFTMQGNESNPGIIPLAINYVFDRINQIEDREFVMRVSYSEIYNEIITDLLQPSNFNLKIHENLTRGIFVGNLSEEIVSQASEAFELLQQGEEHRHIGKTNMNEHSSRSHTLFRIVLESREKSSVSATCDERDSLAGVLRVSTLTFVDLAGSERAGQTGAEGARLREGGHINKSLLALTSVIGKLAEGNDRAHIPYRDSKLTRILQPSLGGNSRTAIICAVTPAAEYVEETISSLKFATRAKAIKNKPVINEVLSEEARIRRYKNEIDFLKARIVSLENSASPDSKTISPKRQKVEVAINDGELMIERDKHDAALANVVSETLISQIASIPAAIGELEAIFSNTIESASMIYAREREYLARQCSDLIEDHQFLRKQALIHTDSSKQLSEQQAYLEGKVLELEGLNKSMRQESEEESAVATAEKAALLQQLQDTEESLMDDMVRLQNENEILSNQLKELAVEASSLNNNGPGNRVLLDEILAETLSLRKMVDELEVQLAQFPEDISAMLGETENKCSTLEIELSKRPAQWEFDELRAAFAAEKIQFESNATNLNIQLKAIEAKYDEQALIHVRRVAELEQDNERHCLELQTLDTALKKSTQRLESTLEEVASLRILVEEKEISLVETNALLAPLNDQLAKSEEHAVRLQQALTTSCQGYEQFKTESSAKIQGLEGLLENVQKELDMASETYENRAKLKEQLVVELQATIATLHKTVESATQQLAVSLEAKIKAELEAQKTMASWEATIASHSAELAQHQTERAIREAKMAESQENITLLEARVGQLTGQIEKQGEIMAATEEKYSDEIAAIRTQLAALHSEKDAIGSERDQLQRQIRESAVQWQCLEDELERRIAAGDREQQKSSEFMGELQSRLDQAETENTQLKERAMALDSHVKNLLEKISSMAETSKESNEIKLRIELEKTRESASREKRLAVLRIAELEESLAFEAERNKNADSTRVAEFADQSAEAKELAVEYKSLQQIHKLVTEKLQRADSEIRSLSIDRDRLKEELQELRAKKIPSLLTPTRKSAASIPNNENHSPNIRPGPLALEAASVSVQSVAEASLQETEQQPSECLQQ